MFINLFKNNYKVSGDNKPDYTVSMKDGEKYVNVGGGWIKESKGGKFISVKLDDEKVLEQLGTVLIKKDEVVEVSEKELDDIPF